ncbi:MAG TPA: sugar transferase [Candidatus Baltobacteraceae bacterium]|nr:sugar transferase [Candidatus Baltobacteraceae bacterium]
MVTEVPVITGSVSHRRTARMPERISRNWRSVLVCGDAAVVLFVSLVALNGATSRIAAAVVVAAIVCGVFWECGYYRKSYAVFARDEIYYACAGVALAAIPVLIILSAVANVPLLSIVLSLVFSAVGTAALRARMHLERRRGGPPYAGIDTITPGAWHDRESPWFLLSKRIFDVTVATLTLVIASPIMLLAALGVVIESGAPVFFRQERVGEGGRPFSIFKFRTMRQGDDTRWVKPGDDRITRVGAFLRRTSIDELPQLFNVLRGEMSIVGPRPEMVEFASSFAKEIPNYDQRHVVAPGITGWAQVYYKRNLQPADMPDVLPFDLFYVEHASVLLDAALVLKTGVEVVFHRAV